MFVFLGVSLSAGDLVIVCLRGGGAWRVCLVLLVEVGVFVPLSSGDVDS